jgi:hypothetical protein
MTRNMQTGQGPQEPDLFRLYLDEVGGHPLLTKDDEIELSQAYEAGLAARAKLKDLAPDDKDRAGLQVMSTSELHERLYAPHRQVEI